MNSNVGVILNDLEENLVIAKNKFDKAESLLGTLKQVIRDLIKEDDDVFLDVEETAKLLRMSVANIRALTCRNNIPHIKKGKRVLYPKQDILNWIMSSKYEDIRNVI